MSNIAIFLHDPFCARDCVKGMKNALQPNHQITIFDEKDISIDFFKKFDCIAFPGGVGDADKFGQLFHWKKAQAVHQYVQEGGKYLGICMGAYWAGSYYFDILNSIEPVQYIKMRDAVIKRSYGTAIPVKWNNEIEDMFFYDGCCFTGDFKNTEIVATYPEGRPAAIIQNNVGIIGPHPESERDWYTNTWKWSYMPDYWHHNKHHHLLLNFVDRLIHGQRDTVQTQRTSTSSISLLGPIQNVTAQVHY